MDIEINLALECQYDYARYLSLCSSDYYRISSYNYAQRLGMLTMAQYQYPELPAEGAYLQFIADMNQYWATSNSTSTVDATNSVTPCGSCGGGTVR